MKSGIYAIISPSGGLYIGSAIDIRRRWREHKSRLSRGIHANAYLQNAWNKYGEAGMAFRAVLICRPEDLIFYEQRAINGLRPRYNLSPTAGNCLGIKRSEKTKEKLAARLRGTKQSPELIAKRSAAMRGRPVSAETRAKLAEQRGWKHSDEAKAKMRGRRRTSEHAKKLGAAHIGNKYRLGKSHTDMTKKKISTSLCGRTILPEIIEHMRAGQRRRHMLASVDYEVKS